MSWGDGSGVPTSGKNLVVVGTDNNGLLHIRIFDAAGNRIKDTDETQLPAQAAAIATLKQQLPGLLPPHVLTDAEKAQVIAEATSIVGQTNIRDRDPVADLSAACHEQGMRFVGYIFALEDWPICENPNHDDWRMRNAEVDAAGVHVPYGRFLCCNSPRPPEPSSYRYRDLVRDRLKELARNYPHLHGVFFDMFYWPRGTCYCEECKRQFKARTTDRSLPPRRTSATRCGGAGRSSSTAASRTPSVTGARRYGRSARTSPSSPTPGTAGFSAIPEMARPPCGWRTTWMGRSRKRAGTGVRRRVILRLPPAVAIHEPVPTKHRRQCRRARPLRCPHVGSGPCSPGARVGSGHRSPGAQRPAADRRGPRSRGRHDLLRRSSVALLPPRPPGNEAGLRLHQRA